MMATENPRLNFWQLHYRRQFLLSSSPRRHFPYWQKTKVSNCFYLEVHPDLELTQVKNSYLELTLLGYIIDPDHPENDNNAILQNIVDRPFHFEALFQHTFNFSGRWIIIFSDKEGVVLFNDPCGLRSVYYSSLFSAPFYCASQPGIIAEFRDAQYKKEAQKDFFKTSAFLKNVEYWWPSGTSLYEGIEHLTPNHFLDLKNKKVCRFWPERKIVPIPLDYGIEKASDLLKNSMNAAFEKFKLALPITAGIDSRTILSATKDISEDVYYYTLLYGSLNAESNDIKIPKRLLSFLGLEHHLLDCSTQMSPSFSKIYCKNVANAHIAWGNIAYGLSSLFPSDRVCVKGNGCEIARCFYYKNKYPKSIDGATLGALAGMKDSSFAIKHFDEWINNTMAIATDFNIDILDLFYWEHRMGSWQSMSQLEWDIVQEAFTPYNNRRLLTILLSVDRTYRKPPDFTLFRGIIQRLWAEALEAEINPKPFIYKFESPIKKLLNSTGTYELAIKIRRLFH